MKNAVWIPLDSLFHVLFKILLLFWGRHPIYWTIPYIASIMCFFFFNLNMSCIMDSSILELMKYYFALVITLKLRTILFGMIYHTTKAKAYHCCTSSLLSNEFKDYMFCLKLEVLGDNLIKLYINVLTFYSCYIDFNISNHFFCSNLSTFYHAKVQ